MLIVQLLDTDLINYNYKERKRIIIMNLLKITKNYGILFIFFILFSITIKETLSMQIDLDESEIYLIKNNYSGKYVAQDDYGYEDNRSYPIDVRLFNIRHHATSNPPSSNLFRIVQKREEPFKDSYFIINYKHEKVLSSIGMRRDKKYGVKLLGLNIELGSSLANLYWNIHKNSDGSFEFVNLQYDVEDGYSFRLHDAVKPKTSSYNIKHRKFLIDENLLEDKKEQIKWTLIPYKFQDIKTQMIHWYNLPYVETDIVENNNYYLIFNALYKIYLYLDDNNNICFIDKKNYLNDKNKMNRTRWLVNKSKTHLKYFIIRNEINLNNALCRNSNSLIKFEEENPKESPYYHWSFELQNNGFYKMREYPKDLYLNIVENNGTGNISFEKDSDKLSLYWLLVTIKDRDPNHNAYCNGIWESYHKRKGISETIKYAS